MINDYALIWSLLFQASISESIHSMKQKIWSNYKDEYNKIYKDKEAILKDPKNFIPNNDTIYNIVLESKEYEKLKKQAEKYRLEVMQIWDSIKKEVNDFLKKILKRDLGTYNILIANKELNIIDYTKNSTTTDKNNSIILALPIDKKEPTKIILNILTTILSNEIKNYPLNVEIFKDAIIELAILNEFATIITKRSCYLSGNPTSNELKRQLYPYWLMFLCVPKEKFSKYMMRDGIVFDIDKYAYEKEFRKLDLEGFIDFCIRNKRYIIRPLVTEII